MSLVDDSRSDRLDLISSAKNQVVSKKKPPRASVHLEGAVLRFTIRWSSFLPPIPCCSHESAKVVIYEAFVEGKLEAPKHLVRTVHDLYFEPKYEEFRPRTI